MKRTTLKPGQARHPQSRQPAGKLGGTKDSGKSAGIPAPSPRSKKRAAKKNRGACRARLALAFRDSIPRTVWALVEKLNDWLTAVARPHDGQEPEQRALYDLLAIHLTCLVKLGPELALKDRHAAVAKASRGGRSRQLPPDPERMNDERAAFAAASLERFAEITGTDDADAVTDLLCDIMH